MMSNTPVLHVLLVLVCLHALGQTAEPLVKSGESIAFLGDSITQQGANSPKGYVRLVIAGLEANGIKATAIPAGVPGDKSDDMLARLQTDVLAKKPVWMTLSCGVNDVAWGAKGVNLDQYKINITTIVDRAVAQGIKVMLLTPTMIDEDANLPKNRTLAGYNDFLRQFAKERKFPLADLNAEMQAGLAAAGAAGKSGTYFTLDGVHMNPVGNVMMATGVLKAMGLNAKQLDRAKSAWQAAPAGK